ncbi:MAG: valine--tRNA ligase [Rickettsiales bacterium]|nr:valine--tRNA ligase [Rickettsiales bacterium]
MKELQKSPTPRELDRKWQSHWQEAGIFEFDWSDGAREEIYSIDTPPPGVSGTLHMGHVFGYSQMDMVARFHRMQGRNVYFPVGYDDNGLPSEKYVEKKIGKSSRDMNRSEFVRVCSDEIRDAERSIRDLFLGASYSFDFREEYRTISETSSKISQMSFLDLHSRGLVYRKEEPVLWDVVDQTALAQSELEDRDLESQMNYLEFRTEDGERITIMTTRPELLPACVAVICHPEDFEHFRARTIVTPLGQRVRILADERVDRTKGTGFVMCCTFGDQTDVEWWKKYNLETRMIVGDGGSIELGGMEEMLDKKYRQLSGLSIGNCRKRILELLQEDGKIARNPEKITHSVKVAERSKAPIEFLLKKQWFIKILDLKDRLHGQANAIEWKPDWMKARLHSWIDSLAMDWCISRQRFFGIPIPVWYSRREGEQGRVILPTLEQLPLDPSLAVPEGYGRDEVMAESDIFDTWATSALTPQLVIRGLGADRMLEPERYDRLKIPFSLRAQGHDIIRTWAFYTILRAYQHSNSIPWRTIMVNGWCLASDGTKMSKSRGNVLDPVKIFDSHGSDALRYWTAKSNLGMDTSYQESLVKNGQRLCTKLLNSARFAEIHLRNMAEMPGDLGEDLRSGRIFESMDLWLVGEMNSLVTDYDRAFGNYDYSRALELVENFFWNQFCDNYLEIVKIRCYGTDSSRYGTRELAQPERTRIVASQWSALGTIYHSFSRLLKLFAPFIPVICEEIYSCLFEDEFRVRKSIHSRGNCAKIADIGLDGSVMSIGRTVLTVVTDVRRYKSERNISLKEKLKKLTIRSEVSLETVIEDLENVCGAEEILSIPAGSYALEFD